MRRATRLTAVWPPVAAQPAPFRPSSSPSQFPLPIPWSVTPLDSWTTVLFTTHYMEEAEQLCDRVAVMDHGRIIALDTPEALINRHFQETAIEFVPLGEPPHERLTALPGVTQMILEDGHPTLYSTDVPRTMAGLFELVTEGRLAFKDMTVRRATLEDVFLKLTGRRIRA